MSCICDLEPFLYDQVQRPDDETGLQLSQEQLQGWLGRLLDCLCEDITALEAGGGGGTGVSTFLGLSDTPASYSGQAGKRVVVNGTEDGLEFETITGGDDGDGLTLDYSTSEQTTTRTWFGGETIYQKTINFGTLPNNTTTSVAHNITNLEYVIRHEFWAERSSDGNQLPIPTVNNTSLGAALQLNVNTTNVVVRTSSDYSAYTGVITLWYTKT